MRSKIIYNNEYNNGCIYNKRELDIFLIPRIHQQTSTRNLFFFFCNFVFPFPVTFFKLSYPTFFPFFSRTPSISSVYCSTPLSTHRGRKPFNGNRITGIKLETTLCTPFRSISEKNNVYFPDFSMEKTSIDDEIFLFPLRSLFCYSSPSPISLFGRIEEGNFLVLTSSKRFLFVWQDGKVPLIFFNGNPSFHRARSFHSMS